MAPPVSRSILVQHSRNDVAIQAGPDEGKCNVRAAKRLLPLTRFAAQIDLSPGTGRGVASRLGLLALALVLIAAAPAATPILLREQAWTPASPERAQILTHAPGECLRERAAQIEIGRALFRSPALLGGPAARAGLSCNACHSNGRVNAHFLLPELTNRPGAADVTSAWASKVRGDGVMNPRDIPDLAGVSRRTAFGHAGDPSLEHFVRSVIEEEFQGPPPSAQAFDGLIAYLRAHDLSACAAETPITLASAADDVRRALAAAQTADAPTASLLLYAAQDSIGRIVERLPASRFAVDRRGLEDLSRDLGALRGGDVVTLLEADAPAWAARFDALIARIARRERRTYFNERTLARALIQNERDTRRPPPLDGRG